MTFERRNLTRAKVTNGISVSFTDETESASPCGELLSLTPSGISLSTDNNLPTHIKIKINLPDLPQTIEAMVEKIWELKDFRGSNQYGFHFTKLKAIDYDLISASYLSLIKEDKNLSNRRRTERRRQGTLNSVSNNRQSTRRLSIPTYPLYIGGRAIDTGQYEYCVFTDKLITNPEASRNIVERLHRGDIASEAKDFVYARYCLGNENHNVSAINSAYNAFSQYSHFPIARKKKIFDSIHNLLLEHKDKLLDLFIAEGHPRQLGEWEFSGMTRAFETETVSFYKNELAKSPGNSKNETILLIRKPDGVVCISPPRNAACSNSLTGALALLGGNTLLCKPPATLPISTIYLWKNVIDAALRKNGAPAGTVNIVVGNTLKFLNAWMKEPKVNDIIYFGESARGLEIGSKIFASGKKPVLELSGKDILTVWDDADIEEASSSLLDCFLGSTQICMVPKMALIHEDIYENFKKNFIKKVNALRVGLPSDNKTCLSPVFKIPLFLSFLEDALQKGARLLRGGGRLNHLGMPDKNGIYLEPTLIEISSDQTHYNFRCIKEETFFPLLPLIKIQSNKKQNRNDDIFKKMIGIINQNEYGLRTSVWCKSNTIIRKFIREINQCGLLRINVKHVNFSEYLATHGGPGKTGGPWGELNYFWQKTTHLQGISIQKKKRT